jgi:RND family efflux transporter MFP subunit
MSSVQARSKLGVFPLAAAILATAGCDEKHPQVAATPPPVVQVAQPVERTVTDYQVFTARTQAVQSVDVKARVTGYLNKINFTDGDLVEEGKTVLFEIDDRPYKASLDQAKAGLDVAEQSLAVAKAGLDVAQANLVKSQADYDIGLNVKKANPGAISDQELTKRLGARDEAKGGVDKAKASIEEAKGSIGKAKAALENAQLYYDWCKVRAPISGRTTRHFVDAGNLVTQDVSVLANIVSLKPVWAYINVDQNTVQRVQELTRAGKVQAARKGEIPVSMGVGAGSEQSYPIAGVIDYVSNQLDPKTSTLQVRAVFPNKDESLVAGLFAQIKVPVSAEHKALLVADSAIGTNQGQRFILVVNHQNEVEYRIVDVGQMHGGLREVKRFREVIDEQGVPKQVEVLRATDRLIVDGLQRVRPGVKVEPRQVNMTTLLVEPTLEPTEAGTKSK